MKFKWSFVLIILIVSSCSSVQQNRSSSLSIEVWHGDQQKVGHLGHAQDDFNLMGKITGGTEPIRLFCFANQTPKLVSIGNREDGFGDARRLAKTGHFNVDIPIHNLIYGPNKITLLATDAKNQTAQRTILVERKPGDYPLPANINWRKRMNPQDVGQYVDGHWQIEEHGLRTQHMGYDRIFLIGNKSWKDYAITVPITIHKIAQQTGPISGGNGLGIIMRFTGHIVGGHRHFPPAQPKWGYQPFGAIGWLRWKHGANKSPTLQFYHGDSDKRINHGTYSVSRNKTYIFKMECETLLSRSDTTEYRFKIWQKEDQEPSDWTWKVVQQSEDALKTGGVALLAHHVDASFGDISIKTLR